MTMGGYLALDWGAKKVGYATADESGVAVTARDRFMRERGGGAKRTAVWELSEGDEKTLRRLINEFESEALILGLPLNADSTESEASRGARALAPQLEKKFGLKVELVAETLSSWEARGSENDDAEAAAILLRDFFAARDRQAGASSPRTGRPVKPKQSGQSVLIALVMLLALGLCAAGFVGLVYMRGFGSAPLAQSLAPGSSDFTVELPPGSNMASLRRILEQKGLHLDAASAFSLRLWARLSGASHKLHAGEFRFEVARSLRANLENVVANRVVAHKLIIKEGHNLFDVADTATSSDELGSALFKNKQDFQALTRDPVLLKEMEVPPPAAGVARSLEGFLFPETYTWHKFENPRGLIEAMLLQFRSRALPLLKEHVWGATPEGRYRLLTLASIVEKESGNPAEQPLVASVFYNRLGKRMRLQSDPTTIYALFPNFDGNLKKIHLQTPSPWNTYTLPELPVSPICNPGETALKAVLHPATSDYLYFVGRGDGTHVFSKDYATHNNNVIKYQLGGKAPAAAKAPPAAKSTKVPSKSSQSRRG